MFPCAVQIFFMEIKSNLLFMHAPTWCTVVEEKILVETLCHQLVFPQQLSAATMTSAVTVKIF